MQNIEEFCLLCYTAIFFKKCVLHLIEAISNTRLCRCRSWGNRSFVDLVFDFVQLSCRSNQGWFGCGSKKVCYRGLLKGWVPRMGIRARGQGTSIVEVVATVGELFAGVVEGLGQRSRDSLRR